MKKIGRRAVLPLNNLIRITSEADADPLIREFAEEVVKRPPRVDRWLATMPAAPLRFTRIRDGFGMFMGRDDWLYAADGRWHARYIGRRNRVAR